MPALLLTVATVAIAAPVTMGIIPSPLPAGVGFIPNIHAAQDCDSTTDASCGDSEQASESSTDQKNETTSTELPSEALATVKELDVKLRYFKAIGFHDKSNAQRESIVAIYEQHGLAVPEKYKK